MLSFIKKHKITLVLMLSAVCSLSIYTYIWTKTPYTYPIPTAIVTEFMNELHKGNYQHAFNNTSKNSYTGRTLSEFTQIAQYQLCGDTTKQFKQDGGTFPIQTNGNRLRRMFNNTQIDMPEVHFEFIAEICHVQVTLRDQGNNQWKIYYFVSHAY